MAGKRFDAWLTSLFDQLEDLHDDLELWFRSIRCSCCDCCGPDASRRSAAEDADSGFTALIGGVGGGAELPPWTPEERNAADDLTIYLEKRAPLLMDDCPEDLKAHLNVSVNGDRMRALNLLSSSSSAPLRERAAAYLLTFARLMLVKATPIADPDLCVPMVGLLGCSDSRVQSGVALAVATFAGATSGITRDANLRALREGGVLAALLPLLTSRSIVVQTHAAGAVTALTTLPPSVAAGASSSSLAGASSSLAGASSSSVTSASTSSSSSSSPHSTLSEVSLVHNHLMTLGVVPSLLQLLRPPHVEDAVLTNNVVGSLLNVSHLPNGRASLVLSGGVPVLVNSLRYLVDEAAPRANAFSSSSSSRRSSSCRSSSSSSSPEGNGVITTKARGLTGGRVGRGRERGGGAPITAPTSTKTTGRKTRDSGANVVEDLSLFYALATLTNLCESPVYRTMIVGVGRFDVVAHLVDIVDSLNATSDEAVKQACVLLRNLAIEPDHRLLLVKSGVVAGLGSLLEALLRRTEKRRKRNKRRKRRSGSPDDDVDVDDTMEPEEVMLAEAMEFAENLCLHRHCRVAIMEETDGKLIHFLFRVVKCATFTSATKRRAIRLLASISHEEEADSSESSNASSAFLHGVYACALDVLRPETPTSPEPAPATIDDDEDAIILDLLALLLGYLGTFSKEERRRILTLEHFENHSELRIVVKEKLAAVAKEGEEQEQEPRGGDHRSSVAADLARFLEEMTPE